MNEFRQPCPNCGNPAGGWDQPRVGWRCNSCWDISVCPDGQEHEFALLGLAEAKSGPHEGGPYRVEECIRCGVGQLGAADANVIAAVEAAQRRPGGGR